MLPILQHLFSFLKWGVNPNIYIYFFVGHMLENVILNFLSKYFNTLHTRCRWVVADITKLPWKQAGHPDGHRWGQSFSLGPRQYALWVLVVGGSLYHHATSAYQYHSAWLCHLKPPPSSINIFCLWYLVCMLYIIRYNYILLDIL